MARGGVEDNQFGRTAAADEQAVISFVQSNGVVGVGIFERPRGQKCFLLAVNDSNLLRPWRVGEHAVAFLLDDEALGLGGEFDLAFKLAIGNPDVGEYCGEESAGFAFARIKPWRAKLARI